MVKKRMSKPSRIREDECIGCTKCIQACPVDAILGAKQMHTVIVDECTAVTYVLSLAPLIALICYPLKKN